VKKQQKLKRRGLQILSFALGFGVLLWILSQADLAALGSALKQVPPKAVIEASLATFVATALHGIRFYWLRPEKLSPLRHANLAFAMYAGNILLPMRAGEIIRPFYIKRWSPRSSLPALIRWTLFDKLIEIIAILPLAVPGLLLVGRHIPSFPHYTMPPARVLVFMSCVLALGGLLLVTTLFRTRRAIAAYATALVMWSSIFCIYWALVPNVDLALQLFFASSCAVAIPALPGGLGAFEAAFVWVGQHAGLSYDAALARGLVAHSLQMAVVLAIGVPLLSHWGWPQPDDKIMKLAAQEQETIKLE
jgi:uncharacterized membrane protein YbhN (UPF0104 family)